MPKTDSSAGRPRRSYQKLTERLRQFMEEGHFRDGDKLPPERALAESFGVSRSSVREAIRALAEKGLLESRQGDGTYVRVPDIEPLKEAILEAVDSEGLMFDEVTEYRRIVEPGIAEIAAVRHTSEQLDRLKIIACDQQRRLLVGENDGDSRRQIPPRPRRMHGQQTAHRHRRPAEPHLRQGAHPGAAGHAVAPVLGFLPPAHHRRA